MRRTPGCVSFLSVLLGAICPLAGLGEAAEPVRVGFAAVDVTPPIGYRMSGYFYERFSTGVHNPLQAKAIVLEQGDVRFAWVFCDMVGVPSPITSAARTEAAEATGIPRENIFFAATHSHTGPLYFGPLRDYFHAQAEKATGADQHEATPYPPLLARRLVEVVRLAAENAAPVEIAAGTTLQHGLSFNRRYVMRNGTVKTNAGKMNPDIVRPAGPIDPEVGLLQFRRDGKPVAGLTVFGLHLDTTGGTEYSADYPFYMERDLRAELGPDYFSAFGIGTCGDVNHLDLSHKRPQKGHEESERIGSTLGATVKTALADLPAVGEPKLAAASEIAQVPLQQYTPAEVAEARENVAKIGSGERLDFNLVHAVKIVGIDDLGVENLPMEVQAFRLSDQVALVALPGELFAELGLAIKQKSPFPVTLVVELSNDYPGYIPTKRGFAEGGYEPTNSKLRPGGGEQLVETAVGLLNQLKTSATSKNGSKSE